MRPAASTPVAWMWPRASFEIQTSFHAGGMPSEVIRSSSPFALTAVPSSRLYEKPLPRLTRVRPGSLGSLRRSRGIRAVLPRGAPLEPPALHDRHARVLGELRLRRGTAGTSRRSSRGCCRSASGGGRCRRGPAPGDGGGSRSSGGARLPRLLGVGLDLGVDDLDLGLDLDSAASSESIAARSASTAAFSASRTARSRPPRARLRPPATYSPPRWAFSIGSVSFTTFVRRSFIFSACWRALSVWYCIASSWRREASIISSAWLAASG